MGHADLSNISNFFIKRLYAKGRLSIRNCSDAMQKAGETFRASEGRYDEPYMLRMGLEDVLRFMLRPEDMGYRRKPDHPHGPIIRPAERLTKRQFALLEEWQFGDHSNWDSGDDGDGGAYGEFDAIEWSFGAGWRKLYPNIPKLGCITH